MFYYFVNRDARTTFEQGITNECFILSMQPVINFITMETEIKDLAKRKCVPCEGGIPPLNTNQIEAYRKEISAGWQVVDNKKLYRKFSFVNYKHTMSFVNRVADIADEEGHHPVMHVNYGSVEIELWTHAINGLSDNDFILAAKIDMLDI